MPADPFFNFLFQSFAPRIFYDAFWCADFKYGISFFQISEKKLPYQAVWKSILANFDSFRHTVLCLVSYVS